MDDARAKIGQRVEKVEREKTAGQVYDYNESETKTGLIDFSNPTEKRLRDDLVALVDVMLSLHERKSPLSKRGAWGDFGGDQLQRQIDKTDREINALCISSTKSPVRNRPSLTKNKEGQE